MKRILVLGAMGLELKAVAAALESPVRAESPLPCTRSRIGANEIVLFRCGVGANSAAGAAEAFKAFAPDFAINAGTAGGLVEGLKVGAVAACGAVVSEVEQGELYPDPDLLERASISGACPGRCLTVRLPLVNAAEKYSVAERTGCSVCEMEAWHVARAAAAAGVPFLALKAVSDALKDSLPDFRRHMDETGALDAKKAALYLASRPDEAARAARFVRSAAAAMKEIARVIAFAGAL